MRIAIKKFKSGERYVFLLDDDGLPDFWVTHFVTQKLRTRKAATSIEQYLKSIKHLKTWESINGRDLLDEIYAGTVPNTHDINALKEHCAYQTKVFKQRPKADVVDMAAFYLSKTQDKPTVTKSQYVSRVAHIAEYLHFCGEERVKNKPAAAQLVDALAAMKKRLKSDMPRGRLKRQPQSLDKSGIADEVFEDFVAVAKINSKDNPFSNPVIKLRNYLIVQTLYETGFRRSELIALRISDIGTETDQPTLSVICRHNSKEDPRLDEPTAKTLSRTLPISKELRDLLNYYVRSCRSQTKSARTHPFVFVSHKDKIGSHESGQPIVKQTVNDVFNRIRKVNSERFWGITPHVYRHFFNDQLSSCIDEINATVKLEAMRLETEGKREEAKLYANDNIITEQRELEIRAELNGHSSLESGRIYLKRTLKKQTSEFRTKMYAKLKHKVEGGIYGR
ncbi:tyrosine-type recombinase/integrase [Agarivorans sp. B2Z047]|uniref:tyrosine-type recombinase/integrase n=1 Tax=Agarivorans sp. B2Z047 TaxID=2652721 RepID=UPI00128BF8B1|nr:site-specific integrase [Agarivorans sp. B2Z047]MPW31616.1 tyrosine-type recombinase/integrase [Agarivorans sp. B2Z047]UQN42424.1 site-specific integrase [Agarivorans sp. B2Z047]